MEYKIEYYLMRGIDGGLYESGKAVRIITAQSDVEAVDVANVFLKARGTYVLLWAPSLHEGERLVANSIPGYPPNAHLLELV